MARTSKDKDLIERLRAQGLRKRAAEVLAGAVSAGRGGGRKSQSTAQRAIGDLRKIADELEGRVTGRGNKRKEAAKKAARTRARKANARSAAAKKGAATRKAASKSSSKSTTRRTKSGSKR